MSGVFYYKEFNDHDLGDTERKKFDEIVKDLKESELTYQGNIKLISSKGDIKYLRAKLSDKGRLLFTQVKHNNEDVFVMLEVIPHHDYEKSHFLKSIEKTKSIEIKVTEEVTEKSSDIVEIKDLERAHWLGKLVTFSATQEDIVENAKLPLIVSGSAGSGKTSVALEKFRKIEEKFEEGKVLYITQSENLINQTKELYEHVYYDKADDEFKIGIPDRIEFLSLHEFLEKKAEDIKGKKPIDRNKFFSWFNEICKKDKFKEYKKDGDKIFEEFTAVIAGKVLLKGYSYVKDQYRKLGKRESIFPENERDSIYDFFKEYKEFVEEDPKYYDPNLIAHGCAEKKIYDAVVVDEVQDLTESTLGLILRSLKDGSKRNFLLCGDVNQVVHPSFFSLSKLKSFLCQNKYIRNQESEAFYTLEKNYRNSEQVIEVANRILHFKNYCFGPEDKMTEDEKKTFFMNSDTKKAGNVSFIADGKKEEIAEKVSGSTSWAVLVLDDEEKENARKLFNTPLVFNIHEAKGLEFENVILYKFFSNKAYNEIWNRVCPGKDPKKIEEAIKKVRSSCQARNVKISQSKDKEDKSSEKYKFYMNALYVGASRAINGVYIMDNEECNLLKAIKPKKIVSVDIKKEESSHEEWRNKALELIDKGNIEQAKSIAETKLLNTKYAEEILKKLETKEYRVASDKEKQASSELKAEPQKSSTMVPNEKRKQHPNEKKKLTRRELEKNTNKLFSALVNNNLELAEQLIRQGINVNAQDNEGRTPLILAIKRGKVEIVNHLIVEGASLTIVENDGDTPLHYAAGGGNLGIVSLLVERGAKINELNYKKMTPLDVAISAKTDNVEVVEYLMKNAVDINSPNHKGFTALQYAAKIGCFPMFITVLACNKVNFDNFTKSQFKGEKALYRFGQIHSLLTYQGDFKDMLNENFHKPSSEGLSKDDLRMEKFVTNKMFNFFERIYTDVFATISALDHVGAGPDDRVYQKHQDEKFKTHYQSVLQDRKRYVEAYKKSLREQGYSLYSSHNCMKYVLKEFQDCLKKQYLPNNSVDSTLSVEWLSADKTIRSDTQLQWELKVDYMLKNYPSTLRFILESEELQKLKEPNTRLDSIDIKNNEKETTYG